MISGCQGVRVMVSGLAEISHDNLRSYPFPCSLPNPETLIPKPLETCPGRCLRGSAEGCDLADVPLLKLI